MGINYSNFSLSRNWRTFPKWVTSLKVQIWELVQWCSWLILCLQRRHPIWVPFCVPAVSLLIQLPGNCLRKKRGMAKVMAKSWQSPGKVIEHLAPGFRQAQLSHLGNEPTGGRPLFLPLPHPLHSTFQVK